MKIPALEQNLSLLSRSQTTRNIFITWNFRRRAHLTQGILRKKQEIPDIREDDVDESSDKPSNANKVKMFSSFLSINN